MNNTRDVESWRTVFQGLFGVRIGNLEFQMLQIFHVSGFVFSFFED